MKFYFLGHVKKIEYLKSSSKSPTKKVEETKTEKVGTDELASLASQLKQEVEELRKADPVSTQFYTVGKKMVIIDPDGTLYKGDTAGGQKYGAGVTVFSDGRIYKGQWKSGAPYGTGMYKTNFGFTVSAVFDSGLNIVSNEAKFFVFF